MSAALVYVIQENGDVVLHGRAPDSWGFAYTVWDKLMEKYEIPGSALSLGVHELWNMVGQGRLDLTDEWVLMATFDRVLFRTEDIPLLETAIRNFWAENIGPNGLSTMRILADLLHEAGEVEGCRGVAPEANSLSCDHWRVWEPDGKIRRYNVDKDANHEWVRVDPELA